MAEAYKRFDNSSSDYFDDKKMSNGSQPLPQVQQSKQADSPPLAFSEQPSLEQTQPLTQPAIYVMQTPKQGMAPVIAPKLMKILVFMQLILSFIIFILTIAVGIFTFKRGRGKKWIPLPLDCSGVFNGIIGIIAGSFGIAFVINIEKKNRCLLITYFVMTIICTVFMFVVITMNSLWASRTGNIHEYKFWTEKAGKEWEINVNERDRLLRENKTDIDDMPYHLKHIAPFKPEYNGPSADVIAASEGLYIAIALLAMVHFISSIVSLALICSSWNKTGVCGDCCGGSSSSVPPTVLYVPPPGVGNGNQSGQAQPLILQNPYQPYGNQEKQFMIVPVDPVPQG